MLRRMKPPRRRRTQRARCPRSIPTMRIKCHSTAKARAMLAAAVSEEERQAAIMAALRLKGYIVLQTSEHRARVQCPKCDKWFVPRNGRGCSPGVPDLLVSRETWPEGLWMGMEVKGEEGKPTKAQASLMELGRYGIVRTVDEALAAVLKFEQVRRGDRVGLAQRR